MPTVNGLYSLCDSHDKIDSAIEEVKASPEWAEVKTEWDRMLTIMGSAIDEDVLALAVAAYARIINGWQDFHNKKEA